MEDGSWTGDRMHEAMCIGARKAGCGQSSRKGVGRRHGQEAVLGEQRKPMRSVISGTWLPGGARPPKAFFHLHVVEPT